MTSLPCVDDVDEQRRLAEQAFDRDPESALTTTPLPGLGTLDINSIFSSEDPKSSTSILSGRIDLKTIKEKSEVMRRLYPIDHNEIAKSACSLPPLPQSASRLARLVADEDSELNEVVKVIEFDPVLTMKLLRMANSVLRCPGRRIGSVKDAVIRLGNGAVCGLAIGASVKPLLGKTIPGYQITGTDYWRHSLAAALAAEVVKNASRERLSALAFTASLLHDIGKLVLGNFLNKELLGWLERAIVEAEMPAHLAEMEILALHHGEVGGIVARHWQLPDAIIAGITYHHDPEACDDPIATVAFLSNMIAHGCTSDTAMADGTTELFVNPEVTIALNRLGLSERAYFDFGPMVVSRLKLAAASYE